MKNFLVIPDKFKGTLSAKEVCQIMQTEIKKISPLSKVTTIPISDGGEGFVDTFLSALSGKKVFTKVKNPFFEEITASYALLDNQTAVIEVAEACGLALVAGRADTKIASTYGVGELILHATNNSGAKKILLGLGGTSTTDGGVGMMAALGVRFFDESQAEFIPTGGTLAAIKKIDASGINRLNAEIICLSDSLNPLYGAQGAALVYAKQKGASEEDIVMLDQGLMHYAKLVTEITGNDKSKTKGTGAAGGLGFSVVSFLGGEICSGIEEILKTINFEERLSGVDFIITGEGKFDKQSMLGKAVDGIVKAAKKYNVPVILIAGCIQGVTQQELKQYGIHSAYITNRNNYTNFEEIKQHAKEDLRITVAEMLRSNCNR